ncbi:hypothetical protein [Microbulbifer litoralis]|uniref:hypothetical protein n=1 Tax=Microbulbifer litoralis TaxID=2933965 RepID=UPI0020288057|nr:hypothetical protein [Microbulbifer sp. GX H0434]
MRNFIKYSSLEFRKHKGLCIPRGPSFSNTQKIRANLLGNTLEFRAPKHAPVSTESIEEKKLSPSVYDLEGRHPSNSSMPSQSWKSADIFHRSWAFYGPWFTGHMGTAICHIKGLSLSQPNTQFNFLHPKGFESAILGFITADWGHYLYDIGLPYFQAPLDWTPFNKLPVPAVSLLVESTRVATYRRKYIFFPISRDNIVCIIFPYRQHCSGSQEEIDKKISPKPMQDLIDNIIGSIRLTLSPETQSAVDEVKKTCPDLSVSPDCAPLKWPAHVDKDGITIVDYDENLYLETCG